MRKTARVAALIKIARAVAKEDPAFQEIKGPGKGDHSTAAYIKSIHQKALRRFGTDYSERRICGQTSYAVDFYFEDEATIVEIALGLPNPSTEFEKDVLNAIIAKESGHPVKKLVLISRAGGVKKCNQAGRTAVREWARSKHAPEIEIHDLPGEPRKRKRIRSNAGP